MMSWLKNWKTTLSGLLAVGVVGYQAYHNPAVLTQPGTLAQLAAGLGLIVAKDAAK
jgi:hypothetical protein